MSTKAVVVHSDPASGLALRCDCEWPMGSGQVWSDPTQVVDGVLRTIRGVTLKVTGGRCVMGT